MLQHGVMRLSSGMHHASGRDAELFSELCGTLYTSEITCKKYCMYLDAPRSLEQFDPTRLDTPAILRKLASACRRLAELKGIAAAIPNHGILINTLGLQDKQGSVVVDYIGIGIGIGNGNELKAAMKMYTASQGRGRPTLDAHEAYSVLAKKIDVLRAMLHGFDYSGFMAGGHKTLAGAADHVKGLYNGKERDGKKRSQMGRWP